MSIAQEDPSPVYLSLLFFFSFRAPEALFQPALLGLEAAGIHETTYVPSDILDISC